MNHVQGGYLKMEFIYQFDSMMTMNAMFNVDLKHYRSKKLDLDTLHKDVSMVKRKDLQTDARTKKKTQYSLQSMRCIKVTKLKVYANNCLWQQNAMGMHQLVFAFICKFLYLVVHLLNNNFFHGYILHLNCFIYN